jgi:hypothetical protein
VGAAYPRVTVLAAAGNGRTVEILQKRSAHRICPATNMSGSPSAALIGKALALFGCCIALILPTACGSSSQTVTAPATSRCAVEAQVESSTFAAPGGRGALRIVTNRECSWSARSEASWVGVSTPASGQGEGSVEFTVAANADPAKRNATLIVNDRRVEISQEGRPCTFQISPVHQQVDASGGDLTAQITASSSQCGWTATADVDWISINAGTPGSGNGVVRFHVGTLSGPPRTGTLRVAGEVVRVEQGTGCTFAVGTSAPTVGPSGGSLEVAVSAPPGCVWSAESKTKWLTIISAATNMGSGHVRVAIEVNSGPGREGSLTVAGRTVTIVQASGCSYTLSLSEQNIPAAGGGGATSVATTVGCPWTAASNADWLTVSPKASSGSAVLQFSAPPNSTIPRRGTITVAGQTITIDQASLCSFVLAPPHLTYDASGGNGAVLVIVSGPCTWTARSIADWITMVSGATGTGDGLVQFTVAPNTGAGRSGVVVIAGQDLAVTQGGK